MMNSTAINVSEVLPSEAGGSGTAAPQPALQASEVFAPQANYWVQLRDCLSDYSADQALLLCEETPERWVAWVPNYGQALIRREQMLKAI